MDGGRGEETAAPAVVARGLRKLFGRTPALDQVSFEIGPGEILGVLGPNGAGKTTLIRILTTVLGPSGGEFSVAGFSGGQRRQLRERIGVLPESAGYPEGETGMEYLEYHGRLYGLEPAVARRRAETLLAEVNLAERGGRLIGTYSRGMRQRLGIARALINRPDVVFLDEPTLGLDPSGQRQILSLVQGLARERQATVLLTTHLLAEVEDVCSRVLILNEGRVVAEGTVAEVVRRAAAPRAVFVRVEPGEVDWAVKVLSRAPEIASAEADTGPPGSLAVTLAQSPGEEDPVLPWLLLAESGLHVLEFRLEGARLNDAFLRMTQPARRG